MVYEWNQGSEECRMMRGGKRGWRTCGSADNEQDDVEIDSDWMYTCIHIYMTYYIYMTYIYMYTYTYTYTHTFTYIYIGIV